MLLDLAPQSSPPTEAGGIVLLMHRFAAFLCLSLPSCVYADGRGRALQEGMGQGPGGV